MSLFKELWTMDVTKNINTDPITIDGETNTLSTS
jgi:hypothetical protein